MDGLVEKVESLVDWGECDTCGTICGPSNFTDCDCGDPRWRPIKPDTLARAAIEAVFDALAEPGKVALDVGMQTAEYCMDSDYDSDADGNRYDYRYLRSDAPASIWTAMLATLRKQALG